MNGTSPSAPVAGTQNPPNAAQRPPRPKKKPLVNPLLMNRRPGQRPKNPSSRPPLNASSNKPGASQSLPQPRQIPPRPAFTERPRSPTPEGKPTIYPVYASQRALVEGFRNHVARLQSKADVDVTNETAFTRPVRLHRRDPNGKSNAPVAADADTELKNEEDEKEKERFEAIKAERQRIREETAKMIAPSLSKKKPVAGKKKIESIRGFETAEDEKRRTLRYEEALPWHLEDFDNKHTWVGTYEATLSDCHIMLVTEEDHFRAVPLEKWYRFKEKSRFTHLDADEAEAMMKKRTKEPRWLLAHKQRDELVKQREKDAARTSGLYKRSGEQEDTKGELFGLGGNTGEDGEDLDFNADELFDDDDEENPFVDVEDEEKDAKERIKKEQLNANIFDLADEKDVDEEEERAQKLAQLQRQLEKGTRKVLVRHEKDHLYDDSDEGNPYTSESEEESNHEAEEDKKDGKLGEQNKINGEKSGTSTKGENTPSDRKKQLRMGAKRPGSPNLSEASGNESSRKKAKLNSLKRAADLDASGASGNESSYKSKKHISASATTRGAPKSLSTLASLRSGSGSESESVRRSRALNLSARGTPAGSRAQSPSGMRAASKPPTRAASPAGRAVSPDGGANSPGAGPSRPLTPAAGARGGLPSKEEILAAVPEDGLSFAAMIAKFKPRMTKKEDMALFTTEIKKVCDVDTKNKWIRRRKA